MIIEFVCFRCWGTIVGVGAGAVFGVAAAGAALPAMGFTATGIAAKSAAAYMMCRAATAGGGGLYSCQYI